MMTPNSVYGSLQCHESAAQASAALASTTLLPSSVTIGGWSSRGQAIVSVHFLSGSLMWDLKSLRNKEVCSFSFVSSNIRSSSVENGNGEIALVMEVLCPVSLRQVSPALSKEGVKASQDIFSVLERELNKTSVKVVGEFHAGEKEAVFLLLEKLKASASQHQPVGVGAERATPQVQGFPAVYPPWGLPVQWVQSGQYSFPSGFSGVAGPAFQYPMMMPNVASPPAGLGATALGTGMPLDGSTMINASLLNAPVQQGRQASWQQLGKDDEATGAAPSSLNADLLEVNQRRHRLTKTQLEILEKAFLENNLPRRYVKFSLARQVGLSYDQVRIWFQNRRAKHKRESVGLGASATDKGDTGQGQKKPRIEQNASDEQVEKNDKLSK